MSLIRFGLIDLQTCALIVLAAYRILFQNVASHITEDTTVTPPALSGRDSAASERAPDALAASSLIGRCGWCRTPSAERFCSGACRERWLDERGRS